MTLILLTLWQFALASASANAVDCESLLRPESDEVAVRGILRESTNSSQIPTWSVWDEALDDDLDVAPGDRVYVLDASGKVLLGGTLEYVRSVLAWNTGFGPKRSAMKRPRLRTATGCLVEPETVKIAIDGRAPVVLLKKCSAETRRRLAPENRRSVEIAPGTRLELRPDEVLISGELRLTFASEMKFSVDYAAPGFTPPRLHQTMRLGVGNEDAGFSPVKNGDLVCLIDGAGNFLCKQRQRNVDRALLAPFTVDQMAWGQALARTRRVVVVRRK